MYCISRNAAVLIAYQEQMFCWRGRRRRHIRPSPCQTWAPGLLCPPGGGYAGNIHTCETVRLTDARPAPGQRDCIPATRTTEQGPIEYQSNHNPGCVGGEQEGVSSPTTNQSLSLIVNRNYSHYNSHSNTNRTSRPTAKICKQTQS